MPNRIRSRMGTVARGTIAELDYGTVTITKGAHKGRIGEYADDESASKAIVSGSPLFASGCHLIPTRYILPVTASDLLRRIGEIYGVVGLKGRATGVKGQLDAGTHIELLTELALIQDSLADQMFEAQFAAKGKGRRVFISHSSSDHFFARLLAIDLATAGHQPWLDEWEIVAGESIPTRISEGLQAAEFIVVVLSEIAVKSERVEREWQSKYWDEVNSKRISVVPVLLRPCGIPLLLRPKKYADLTAIIGMVLSNFYRPLRVRIGASCASANYIYLPSTEVRQKPASGTGTSRVMPRHEEHRIKSTARTHLTRRI